MKLFRKLKHAILSVSLVAGLWTASAEEPLLFPGSLSSDLDQCDDLYEQRVTPSTAWEAVNCYRNHLHSTPSEPHVRRAVHTQVLYLLSRLYIHASTLPIRRRAVDTGTNQVAQVEQEFAGSAMALYWKAVFISLDCQLRDAGRMIPSCIMGKKAEVIALLQKSMSIDPSIHGNGADRVYGIMLREMPPMVGGDRELALKHLKHAYDGSPNFSSNHLEYAKTLRAMRRDGEARLILQQLVGASCLTMNPLLILECSEDQIRARELLNRI